ncbi:MAG: FHA domain-containing protein [Chloroflexota bacterium]
MTQSSKCSYCGFKNRDGVLFCEECAFPLTGSADETAKESQMEQAIGQFRRAATDHFGHEAILVLHIRNEAEPLVIEIGDSNLAVGRTDSVTGRKVDIDLTPYNALQKGVSRLHAVLFRSEDDTLYLADAGSSNGTFLNGHQLPANEASPVSNGDEITLGKMRMHAYFERRAVTRNS